MKCHELDGEMIIRRATPRNTFRYMKMEDAVSEVAKEHVMAKGGRVPPGQPMPQQPTAGVSFETVGHTLLVMRGVHNAKRFPKRYRMVLRDNISGITKPAIRRLARRAGVVRISGLVYEEVRGVLRVFLEDVIRGAVLYCEHAKRTTVTAMDIVYALKRRGYTIYGYGG